MGKVMVSISNLESKDEQPSTTKDNSNNTSIITDLKQTRKEVKNKIFNQSADNLLLPKPKSKLARRSEMSPIKQPEPKKIQKVSKHELMKHKRTSTETSEAENISEGTAKLNRQFRMKPLHRISEVLTEADTKEDPTPILPSNPKDKGLPLFVTRDG